MKKLIIIIILFIFEEIFIYSLEYKEIPLNCFTEKINNIYLDQKYSEMPFEIYKESGVTYADIDNYRIIFQKGIDKAESVSITIYNSKFYFDNINEYKIFLHNITSKLKKFFKDYAYEKYVYISRGKVQKATILWQINKIYYCFDFVPVYGLENYKDLLIPMGICMLSIDYKKINALGLGYRKAKDSDNIYFSDYFK